MSYQEEAIADYEDNLKKKGYKLVEDIPSVAVSRVIKLEKDEVRERLASYNKKEVMIAKSLLELKDLTGSTKKKGIG